MGISPFTKEEQKSEVRISVPVSEHDEIMDANRKYFEENEKLKKEIYVLRIGIRKAISLCEIGESSLRIKMQLKVLLND